MEWGYNIMDIREREIKLKFIELKRNTIKHCNCSIFNVKIANIYWKVNNIHFAPLANC